MYTQCPDCLAIYQIAATSLQSSHGTFRCGHCGSVFNALPSLSESLPEAAIDMLPRSESSEVPAVLSMPTLLPEPISPLAPEPSAEKASAPEPELAAPAADWVVFRPGDSAATPIAAPASLQGDLGREHRYAPAASVADTDAVAPHAVPKQSNRARYDLGPAPSAKAPDSATKLKHAKPSALPRLHEPLAGPASGRLGWLACSIALALGLLAQLGYYQRGALLSHGDFRPLLERACGVFGCVLPLRQDLAQFKVLDSTVKPHPRVKGALLISASLLNDAPFAQDYPVVEVKLLNETSTPLALRRFGASEYLRSSSMAQGIGSGASLPVVFEVLDPGSDASGFEFSFFAGPYLATSPSVSASD
jgi:predicted Zn finger-like uncharacterized protein